MKPLSKTKSLEKPQKRHHSNDQNQKLPFGMPSRFRVGEGQEDM